MSLKDECTLNDTTKLRKLIAENPDCPILVFCSEDSWDGEAGYNMATSISVEVRELILYNDRWYYRDDYDEVLFNDLVDKSEYADLSGVEFNDLIDKMVATAEYVKAIVLLV